MDKTAINSATCILEVKNLGVSFSNNNQFTTALREVSFQLHKGESIGIVGESGSGKSVTALSVLNLLSGPTTIQEKGEILFKSQKFGSVDLLKLQDEKMQKIRGNEIGIIFQEPMTSLNPVFTCGYQVAETLRVHRSMTRNEAREKTLELFREVNLPRPEKSYNSYPHELSGGQKQRVMIAMAMCCHPSILIADEPTTALDVTVQSNILRVLERLRDKHDTSVIFISHDLGVIAEVADRILIMHEGRIVEQGNVFKIFNNPEHPYTKGLLACRPRLDIKMRRLPTVSDFMKGDHNAGYTSLGQALLLNAELKKETIEKRLEVIKGGPILRVKNLTTSFVTKRNILGKVAERLVAVDDVSFEVYPGETVGLVGESGCGKTTLGRSLIRLIEPDAGEIEFDNQPVLSLRGKELRRMRKHMQIIFQDPYSSLNPRVTVGDAIAEPLKIHRIVSGKQARINRAKELMLKVGLEPSHYYRFPHEFSGGQRQRVCIARALATNPSFIICDESVSALDVSVQAQVLNLLNDLKKEFRFTYLFISHDLSVVKFMADRIFVMNNGKLVEMGYPDALFDRPKEEYTRNLINAIPKGDVADIRKAQLRRRLAFAKKSLFPTE